MTEFAFDRLEVTVTSSLFLCPGAPCSWIHKEKESDETCPLRDKNSLQIQMGSINWQEEDYMHGQISNQQLL